MEETHIKMKVVLLSTYPDFIYSEYELVKPNWFFNPVQDCNGNWVLSIEEVSESIYEKNDWLKKLPLINWCAPIPPSPFPPIN